MLHLDEPVGGLDVAHGRDRFTLAGGTAALVRLGQLGLGRAHGAAVMALLIVVVVAPCLLSPFVDGDAIATLMLVVLAAGVGGSSGGAR